VRAGWRVRGVEVIGDRIRGLRYLLVVREDSLSIIVVQVVQLVPVANSGVIEDCNVGNVDSM
jgi:hypothetical protein